MQTSQLNRLRAYAPLSIFALLSLFTLAACDETALDPNQKQPITLEFVDWPDTLVAGEESTLRLRISDPEGRDVTDAEVRWSVSSPVLLDMDTTATSPSVEVKALRPGPVSVTASVSGERFQPAETSDSLSLVLSGIELLEQATPVLTAFVSGATYHVRGVGVSGYTVEGVEATWDRIGPGAVALSAEGDSARVTALQSGADTLVITSSQCGTICRDTTVVEVEWLSAVTAGVDSVVLTAFADSVELSGTARDRYGNTTTDPALLRWTSLDTAIVAIGSGGQAVARGSGATAVVLAAAEVADTVPVEVEWLSGIALTKDTSLLTAFVDTATLTATATDRLGNSTADPSFFAWESLDTSAVTVSASGLARAARSGVAAVVASARGRSDTLDVEVEWVSEVTASADSVLLTAFVNSAEISAAVRDRYGNTGSDPSLFTWTSLNTSVATVSGTGGLNAHANGSSDVVVSSEGLSDTVWVEVEWLSELVLSPDTVLLSGIMDTATLTATAIDRYGNSTTDPGFFSWRSLGTYVVVVNAGRATARADGATSLIVSAKGLTDTARVDVEWVSAVALDRDTVLLDAIDDTATIRATAVDRFGNTTSDPLFFRWSTVDWSVGRADTLGIVTAKNAGSTLVIATVEKDDRLRQDTATVRVDQIPAGIRIASAPVVLFLPDTIGLRADVIDRNGFRIDDTTSTSTWTSVDASVASVSAGDSLTAHSQGQTKLIATDGTLADTADATVTTLVQLSGGGTFTCGLTATAEAYCWGWGTNGKLGHRSTSSSSTPVHVVGGHAWSQISAGNTHACGITTSRSAYCWGRDGYLGILGTGLDLYDSAVPLLVAEGHEWAQVSAGEDHTCGVTTSGEAYCWGWGYYGRLGDGWNGLSHDRIVPTLVLGGHQWSQISTGDAHTCGVTTAGDAYCWGFGRYGGLGDGAASDRAEPVLVAGGHQWKQVAAGEYHSCGVTTTGNAFCWGYGGEGQLGTGSTLSSTTPVAVTGSNTWSRVSAGKRYTCGEASTADVYCWGSGEYGQLGVGSTSGSSTPVIVSAGSAWTQVSASVYHTCGVTADGEGYCWGQGDFGQLGNAAASNSSTPVRVVSPASD